jgi:hypothetical protein
MLQLFFLAILAWNNSIRAKRKELSPTAWAIYTVIAYFSCFVIGTMVVVFGFCRKAIDFNMMSSPDEKVREEATKMLVNVILSNPLHSATLVAFGFGGYVLVRYMIDSKPDKKLPVHWMDEMGE